MSNHQFGLIGKSLEHSFSEQFFSEYFSINNLNATYKNLEFKHIEALGKFFEDEVCEYKGLNVTIPYKMEIMPFLDELSDEAENTQSVNTLYLRDNKVIGHNTDIIGFQTSIKKSKYNISNKEIFILGAGGVVPSIIFALNKMKVSKIKISNRTIENAENVKKLFKNIEIIEWGEVPSFDMIINATSIGLKKEDYINLDFSLVSKNCFFYDVIYNPKETNFLKTGKKMGNITLNGKLMFIHQALSAFNIWHGVKPDVNEEVINLLD